ncbi:CopD family copper resistance protein [Helicobacter bizzozeronii]|nr:CopD family copper resistance protein [Helicobacter bizzozeronii]
MQALYPYLLISHLLCAIIFIGYLFFDVVIFPSIKKIYGEEIAQKAQQGISARAIKIMPLCVLWLLLSGGMMLSVYVGGDKGFLETPFQKVLMLKVLLACTIFAMVAISLACKFLNKKNPLASVIHPLALLLGLGIVICAKWMWFAS